MCITSTSTSLTTHSTLLIHCNLRGITAPPPWYNQVLFVGCCSSYFSLLPCKMSSPILSLIKTLQLLSSQQSPQIDQTSVLRKLLQFDEFNVLQSVNFEPSHTAVSKLASSVLSAVLQHCHSDCVVHRSCVC